MCPLELKLRCRQECFHLEVVGENPFPPSSRFWRLLAFLGSWPHPSNFCSHLHISLTLSLLTPSYKDSCDPIGPTWIIQDNLCTSGSLTLSHLRNPFCHVKCHIHWFWGLEHGHLSGGAIQPNTLYSPISQLGGNAHNGLGVLCLHFPSKKLPLCLVKS